MATAIRSKIDSLLVHILRCPGVFHTALQHLEPAAFVGERLYVHRFIWGAAKTIYEQYKVMPNEHLLTAEVLDRIEAAEGHDQTLSSLMKTDAVQLIQAIFEVPEKYLAVKYAENYLQEVIDASKFKPTIVQLQMAKTSGEFKTAVEGMYNTYHSSRIVVPKPVNMTSPQAKALLREIRIPTGTEYIDALLNGGMTEGRAYGLLGGSGGGKTLVAVEVGCKAALKGHHVNYFSYEQSLLTDADIQRRIYGCAGNIKRQIIADVDINDWPDDAKKSLAALDTTLWPFLHTYDMSGVEGTGFGGADELEPILRNDQLKGQKAFINIVDWVVQAVDMQIGAENLPEDSKRAMVSRFVKTCKNYAAEYGGCWLLLNQLAPGELGGPGKLPQWTSSAEAKNFAWSLDVCFSLGVKDQNGVMLVGASKNRGAKSSHTVVQINPDYARMIWRDKMTYNHRNKQGFVPLDHDEHEVPKDEAPSQAGGGLR